MSQFDKLVPNNGYQNFNPLLGDGETRYGAQTGNTTASAVAAINTTIAVSTGYNVINQNCRGALFYLKASSFPVSGSVNATLKVRMITDPIAGAGVNLTIAAFAPIGVGSSAGAAYCVYPAPMTVQAASGFNSGNYCCAPLPRNYQLWLSLSSAATGNGMTFSLSVQHLL